MKCGCKIIPIMIIVFLTILIVCTLSTLPNLSGSISSAAERKLGTFIGLKYAKKPYFFNLSPSPTPSQAPAPAPAPTPTPVTHHHVHPHYHRPIPRHLPPISQPHNGPSKRKVLVAVLLSACGATSLIFLVGLFLGCRKLRIRKASSSKNVKRVISNSVTNNFYLESLGAVLDRPPISTLKHDSDDDHHDNLISNNPRMNALEEEEKHSENLESSAGIVTSIESLKFDEEDEQVFFGSPIGEEQDHSSDNESFHSFYNSHRSSNASVTSDLIQPLPTTAPPPPPPPPPMPSPQPPTLYRPSTSISKNMSRTVSSPRKSVSSTGSNQTPIPPPPHVYEVNHHQPPTIHNYTSLRFDEDMIESLFGYNLHNTNEDLKSKSPSPSKHVLDPKRLQNLTILLKALNATTEQVCRALVQGNGLNLQQLEVLVKIEPTKEEEAKLKGYKGELGSAEAFVASILAIPYAFPRIEALLYRETFEDEVTHLRKTFSMVQEACKELKSSRLFLKLLEAVLKTGNRMNVGTIRGGAKAFKLDTLLKLSDVKGTDGKTTLLHFVVQEIVRSEGVRVSESIIGKINQKSKRGSIEDREEDYRNMGLELVAGLSNELCNVKKTATIDFEVIASSVSNLSQGMSRLRTLVDKYLLMEEKSCSFVESIKSFLTTAQKRLEELEDDEHKSLDLVKEITEYFHGNMSKDEANPLRIFVIVRDFLAMLDLVCRELRRSKCCGHPNPLAPFQ
ncbi:formin-like protein 11 [Tanacetum coccineum]